MRKAVRVLIAEDDYLVNREIHRSLRGGRYEIAGEAGDGEEAVKMTRDLRPDVVFMDIKMPKLDGLEASARIQKEIPTPIVILTAYDTGDLLEAAGRAGAGAYLLKPPKTAEIDRAVAIAMARHGDLMELRRRHERLKDALSEIRTLRGILPICSFCKKIRDDEGYWKKVDVFIKKYSRAEISRSLCPDCLRKLHPGMEMENREPGR